MQDYFHSVTLVKEKCKGCTHCLRRCPTEAIRVRNGKATIIKERCIDCGVCIHTCPYHAKVAVTDSLSEIARFPYRIALPAPVLYGQFKNLPDIQHVLGGLMSMGFDEVFEVARGADMVTCALAKLIKNKRIKHNYPLISSACPAIVRLIQVRFPELIENIVSMQAPMEVAAYVARREFCEKRGVKPEEVGVFFITPCPAKVTNIRNPVGQVHSNVSGAISMLEIYAMLSQSVNKPVGDVLQDRIMASFRGVGWAKSGGEANALGVENTLAVDGIDNVIHVLEEIENNKLTDLEFFEGLACDGGCVGGPLTFENAYVAKNRIRRLVDKLPCDSYDPKAIQAQMGNYDPRLPLPIQERQVLKLDGDISSALNKMERIDALTDALPGLDCGSCGAPTCRALAEDIVRGQAHELDCIFKLKEKVKFLAEEMVTLAEDSPSRKDEQL